jgi:CheY-like chemotaxis protein
MNHPMLHPAEDSNPLPLPNEAGAPASQSPCPAIFCVDDDPDDRLLFADLLRQAGCSQACQFYDSGEALLDGLLGVLRGAPEPVACFMDVKMTGMSGLDVLRWIRCQRDLDTVPVIMMSSFERPDAVADALRCGAQCFIKKFPRLGELREIMSEARRFGRARSAADAFPVACNLLVGAQYSTQPAPSGSAPDAFRSASAS